MTVAASSTEIDRRVEDFRAFIESGGVVETTDWMPDEYRLRVRRFIEMHANSEIMGALPERDWISRAPSLTRKLTLSAKIQDEVGHAQMLYRLVEDLGKPREQVFDDLISGRSKFHNVFHYPTRSWADVGVIGWLVDAAAILSQSALLRCSYAPYARVMKRICWEEAFHLKPGVDVCLTLAGGTAMQRDMLQEALTRWWEPLMMFHGPATPPEKDGDLAWRIKAKTNDTLRQEFLDRYVPAIWEIGMTLPDPALAKDADTGRWHYTEPDWSRLAAVASGHGPASADRLGFRRLTYEDGAWLRAAVLN
jgi:ring-1,2-phenylacetyl-CoA epoxidase subunit PaaA